MPEMGRYKWVVIVRQHAKYLKLLKQLKMLRNGTFSLPTLNQAIAIPLRRFFIIPIMNAGIICGIQ